MQVVKKWAGIDLTRRNEKNMLVPESKLTVSSLIETEDSTEQKSAYSDNTEEIRQMEEVVDIK